MKELKQPKIVGKIDLSTFERKPKKEQKRNTREIIAAIDEGMSHSVPLINERAASFEGAPNPIVDQEGKINMDAYVDTYGDDVVFFDKNNALQQKRGFYQTYTKKVQERYGTKDEDQILEKIAEEERLRDGNISEEALFLLMNKIVGDRYMAVRSCDHDDFLNGTDLMLVDTVSGETICAFDETVEGKDSRLGEKITRAKSKLIKGHGMSVKYGITFEAQEGEDPATMQLKEVKDIPPMFLPLQKTDLNGLLQEMDFNIDSPVGEREKEVMAHLHASLQEQIGDLEEVSEGRVSYSAVRDFISHLGSNIDYVK